MLEQSLENLEKQIINRKSTENPTISRHQKIDQSNPFENVILALKTDSPLLFKNSFSQRVIDGDNDLEIWGERIMEGKENFNKLFGKYELADFTFAFDSTTSKLIVFFKTKEQFRMRVVNEGNAWKLDEK